MCSSRLVLPAGPPCWSWTSPEPIQAGLELQGGLHAFEWGLEGQTLHGLGKERETGSIKYLDETTNVGRGVGCSWGQRGAWGTTRMPHPLVGAKDSKVSDIQSEGGKRGEHST